MDKFYNDYQRASTSSIPGDTSYYTNLSNSIGYPSLTGSVYVANENGAAIREADITEKYNKIWNKLKIYAANVEEAYIAKYVQRLDTGKDKEIETIRYVKGENVHPTVTNKIVTKQNYIFRGWTLDSSKSVVNDNEVQSLINSGIIYTSDDDYAGLEALTFSNENDVYTFYAVFSITSYRINFVDAADENGRILDFYDAPYGSYLHDPEDYYTTVKESELDETHRYTLIGWVRDPANAYPRTKAQAKTVDLTRVMSQNTDQTFYGCFIQEDCLTTATDMKYLSASFEGTGYQDPYGNTAYDIPRGFLLSAKPGIHLGGKITLPTTVKHTDGNEYPVIGIAQDGFMGTKMRYATELEKRHGASNDRLDDAPDVGYNITHVYWLGDTSNVRIIYGNAFKQCGAYVAYGANYMNYTSEFDQWINGNKREPGFVYFQMPTGIREIKQYAFAYNYKLRMFDFSETDILSIGNNAFEQSFYSDESSVSLIHLPGSLKEIRQAAFNYIFVQNVSDGTISNGIEVLQFGGPGDPSNLTTSGLGNEAFNMYDYTTRIQ